MVLGITPLWGLLAVGMITAPDTLTTKVRQLISIEANSPAFWLFFPGVWGD